MRCFAAVELPDAFVALAERAVVLPRSLSVSVSTVTVFSSTLTPSGPRYRRVETVGIRES